MKCTLDFLSKSKYLRATTKHQNINSVELLPFGSVLFDNIRREWAKSGSDINTYTTQMNGLLFDTSDRFAYFKTKNFRENVLHVKDHFQQEWPLAIKEELKFEGSAGSDTGTIMSLTQGLLLSTCYFFNESMAAEKFHNIQRERKIWWMRFSTNPGRYFMSNLVTEEVQGCKTHSVEIQSKFTFGDLKLEDLQIVPLRALELENVPDFLLKDTRLNRYDVPSVIQSKICLEAAVVGLLLDATEDSESTKIAVHRKLAPYQCSIFSLAQDPGHLSDLDDLSKHLSSVIRKAGITALNLQKCHTTTEIKLNQELKEMDKIGVPYSIILEPITLQNGLMKLRSRDTTLTEVIHITDVPDYLVNIFNS